MEKSFIEWLQYCSKSPGVLFMEIMADKINLAHAEIGNPIRYDIRQGKKFIFFDVGTNIYN